MCKFPANHSKIIAHPLSEMDGKLRGNCLPWWKPTWAMADGDCHEISRDSDELLSGMLLLQPNDCPDNLYKVLII